MSRGLYICTAPNFMYMNLFISYYIYFFKYIVIDDSFANFTFIFSFAFMLLDTCCRLANLQCKGQIKVDEIDLLSGNVSMNKEGTLLCLPSKKKRRRYIAYHNRNVPFYSLFPIFFLKRIKFIQLMMYICV